MPVRENVPKEEIDKGLTSWPRFSPEALEPGTPREVNIQTSVYDAQEVQEILGFEANVPAVVQAADRQLWLVDIRDAPRNKDGVRHVKAGNGKVGREFEADFLLVDPEDWNGETLEGFRGVISGGSFFYGRGMESDRKAMENSRIFSPFKFSPRVSGRHFMVEYGNDGDKPASLSITDTNSTNGTWVANPPQVEARHTLRAVSRARLAYEYSEPDQYAPYGRIGDDPIIGRKSPRVTGGIYVSGSPHEAVTVKPDEDPRLEYARKAMTTHMARRGVLRRAVKKITGGKESLNDRLRDVSSAVQKVMRYDGETVDDLLNNSPVDEKLSLGEFLKRRVGVCRHQALTAAYLMESLISEGKLEGTVRVERNTIPEYKGAHAWAILTDTQGTEYVVDPAQGVVGDKKELRRKQGVYWNYYLPTAQ